MEDPKKIKTDRKQLPLQFNKTVWIQNQSTDQYSHKKVSQFQEDFKKQHQQYLANKMKRRIEERKLKIQQFGDSSSSDQELPPILHTAKSQSQPHKLDQKPSRQSHEQSKAVKLSSSPGKRKEKKEAMNMGSGKKQPQEDSFGILVTSKKGVDVWLQQKAQITDKVVVLPHCQYPFYDINKLKLIFTDIGDRCFKLKISWKNEEYIFGASSQKQHKEIPLVFYIFARIVQSKLQLMGKKPLQNLQLSSNGIPSHLIQNSFIYGGILKKSRVLSRWTQVFAVINKEGLIYYKKINEKGELLVPRGTITELWSRFEWNDGWLVIKLFQNSHKIELGIPFYDQISARAWLFNIYNLVNKI